MFVTLRMNSREIFRTNILEILHFSDRTSSFASLKSTHRGVEDENNDTQPQPGSKSKEDVVVGEQQRLPSPFDEAFENNGQIIMASNIGTDGAITLAVVVRKMNMFLSTSNVYVCQQNDPNVNNNSDNKKTSSNASSLRKFNLINSHCDG